MKPWRTKVVEEWEEEMHQWWWDRYYLLEDRLSQEGDEETLKLVREHRVVGYETLAVNDISS